MSDDESSLGFGKWGKKREINRHFVTSLLFPGVSVPPLHFKGHSKENSAMGTLDQLPMSDGFPKPIQIVSPIIEESYTETTLTNIKFSDLSNLGNLKGVCLFQLG